MVAELFGSGRGIGIPTQQSPEEDTRQTTEDYQDSNQDFGDPISGNPNPSTHAPQSARPVRRRTRTTRRNLPVQQKGSDSYRFPQ